jgi:translation initiation factor IF-3
LEEEKGETIDFSKILEEVEVSIYSVMNLEYFKYKEEKEMNEEKKKKIERSIN